MEFSLFQILIDSFKTFKGFILPGISLLVLLLLIEVIKDYTSRKSKIRWFLTKKNIKELQELSPHQFEEYIAQLFNSLGYKSKVVGGVGDGGIDVEAEKDGKMNYIQCKKFITRQVPVGAVRDFYGAIADKLNGGKGYFITTNIFTLPAEEFAKDKPIELIDRFKLIEYMKLAGNPNIENSQKTNTCPNCGCELKERDGKFGKFVGCSNYPKCTYTQDLN